MHIVSVCDNGPPCSWNVATGDCEAELKDHLGQVMSAVFSSDSMHIISASRDHIVQIWDPVTGECEAVLNKPTSILSFYNQIQSHIMPTLPNGVFAYNDVNDQICLSSQLCFLDMYKDAILHTKTLQNLWIPPLFHEPSCISHHLSKIYLGYASGHVLVLEVSMIS